MKAIKRARTPTILQMEAVECGAAALAIVLAYFGRRVPLEELRIACGVSRDGSKASNIVKAARTFGLEAKGHRHSIGELNKMPLPVILFWNFNHFLVLEGFGKKGRVYINDPASGPRVVTGAEFDKAYTGIVLSFAPTGEFQRGGGQKNLAQRLLPRLAGLHGALLFVVIATLGLVIPGLLMPTFTKVFIDDYLIGGHQDWVRPLLLGMACTAVVRAALTALQQNYLLRLDKRLAVSMSGSFFWHVLRLPVEFFQQRYAGDIAQRVGSNDTVAELLSGDLATNTVNLIMLVFFAALMFQYDVVLAVMSIIIAIINLLVLSKLNRVGRDGNLRMQQDHAKLMAATMGAIQMIETLKASGRESDFFMRWSGYMAKVLNTSQKVGLYSLTLGTLPTLLDAISHTAVLGYGGYQVMQGEMTVGTLVAFQSLMSSFMGPVGHLLGLVQKVQIIEADLTRLDDVLHYPVDPLTQDVESVDAGFVRLTGRLELCNVSFGYSPLDPPLIENLNLTLKPGQRIALVGGSGSGKSTIAKLIVGLNKPWGGEILFDGLQRSAIPRQVLVSSLAHVDQDIVLFEGTIRENLCLWDGSVPEGQMLQAAKDAQIHDVIGNRPGGYDGPVTERGSNFSGGQSQRLEIARALVHAPSLLVMDEATSALDPLTEKQIDDCIRRRGCACLIVAHRLSTIRDADEIIVLEHGKVVQRGTHDELLALGGLYANLIRME
ncbi:NHLP family bacteriocin export ABC transporter peptidase/permease/ATPase subunit [Candidatus Methylospira mobilis]|uniref:NHLP family bacteriocin export ABC transporter peptidase/permease/ATPase subunit n=1 Tax=Candidatus Methylospira mobilis TaxID=1808979 RepID=A0A5Q0BHC4_9GAMM|nr:NHLP family bacteriocin export ABC transporter peptidase/permease/ATPase subunit [Candidatus Methylospira mobilis]QFY43230.1 NHLP family bacteriocin export ABC transporter peptidase/permease/ATPase subunit [Candidatus Methylospira mobilis]